MKGWTRGKKVALIAGTGALLLVPVAAVSWKKIHFQLEVRRLVQYLERDDSHFRKFTDLARELPMYENVIDSFLRKRAGKEALFRWYEDVVLEPVFTNTRFGDLDLEETLFAAVLWNTDSHAFYAEWYPPRQLCLSDIRLHEQVRAVNELMDRLASEEFRSTRYPRLSFQFVPPEEALEACPRVTPEVQYAGEGEAAILSMHHVCLVRRDEPEILRALTALLEESRNPVLMSDYLDALGDRGPAAAAAAPAIRALLEAKRGEEWVWERAERALRRITGGGGTERPSG